MGVKSGGTSSALYGIVQGIEKYKIEVLTYALNEGDELPGNKINVHFINKPDNRFGYSSDYSAVLNKADAAIYHTHGLWQYTEYITAKIARKKKVPYIITPHGMLYPQALRLSKLKKRLFLNLFLLRDLNKAAAIHVTADIEMQHIRNLGITSPIAVIPNPIEAKQVFPISKDKIRVGYLGRVHPRKNIERLIYAWHDLGDSVLNSELVIIGAGDERYLTFLKDEVSRLELKNVCFTGFLVGEEKEKTLQSLSYLAVPSDFENFGMIVAEALQLGIPVIASKGTPWEDLETSQCGWWVDNDVETLTKTIGQAIKLPESERLEMGQRGQQLIKEKYSVEVVSKQMSRLYDWVLKGGEKPEFVYLK